MGLMRLNIGNKGVFVLGIAIFLIFILMSALVTRLVINKQNNDIRENILTDSYLITKKAVLQNNINNLIKNTIKNQMIKTNLDETKVISNTFQILNSYFKDNNYVFSNLSENSLNFTFITMSENKLKIKFDYRLVTQISKEFILNNKKIIFILDAGAIIGGEINE